MRFFCGECGHRVRKKTWNNHMLRHYGDTDERSSRNLIWCHHCANLIVLSEYMEHCELKHSGLSLLPNISWASLDLSVKSVPVVNKEGTVAPFLQCTYCTFESSMHTTIADHLILEHYAEDFVERQIREIMNSRQDGGGWLLAERTIAWRRRESVDREESGETADGEKEEEEVRYFCSFCEHYETCIVRLRRHAHLQHYEVVEWEEPIEAYQEEEPIRKVGGACSTKEPIGEVGGSCEEEEPIGNIGGDSEEEEPIDIVGGVWREEKPINEATVTYESDYGSEEVQVIAEMYGSCEEEEELIDIVGGACQELQEPVRGVGGAYIQLDSDRESVQVIGELPKTTGMVDQLSSQGERVESWRDAKENQKWAEPAEKIKVGDKAYGTLFDEIPEGQWNTNKLCSHFPKVRIRLGSC